MFSIIFEVSSFHTILLKYIYIVPYINYLTIQKPTYNCYYEPTTNKVNSGSEKEACIKMLV